MLRILIIRHLGYKKNLTEAPPYFTKVLAAFLLPCAIRGDSGSVAGWFLVWIIHTKILILAFRVGAFQRFVLYVVHLSGQCDYPGGVSAL